MKNANEENSHVKKIANNIVILYLPPIRKITGRIVEIGVLDGETSIDELILF